MTTTLLAGLTTGAIYAFIALGYNVTHLASGALNFAHANLMMLGLFLTAALFGADVPFPLIVVIVSVSLAVLAAVEERLVIRTLRDRTAHTELITTLGAGTIITGVVILIWGVDPIPVDAAFGSDRTFLSEAVQLNDIVIITVVILLSAAMLVLFKRTKLGLAALAQNEDREAALLRGIDVKRLSLYGFALSGLVVGIGAVFIGHRTFAVSSIALILAIKGFVALTLGGVGSFEGALIGGLAIGVFEAFTARYVGSEYRDIAVFFILVAILLARPQGLFGRAPVRMV